MSKPSSRKPAQKSRRPHVPRKAGKPAPSSRPAPPQPHNWQEHSVNGLRILQVPAFTKFPWLTHGFSTVQGGVSQSSDQKVLNLGFTAWDKRQNVEANRRLFQSALGAKDFSLLPLKQIHSDLVREVETKKAEPFVADASVTIRPNLLLAVQTADCVPILLV